MDARRPDPEFLASLALDDEIDHVEMLDLLDTMADDPDVRAFWRAARRTEARLDAVRSRPAPRRTFVRGRGRSVAAVSAIAAAVVLVVGLMTGIPRAPQPSTGTAEAVQVRLGEAPESMDDARFVELTLALLRADHRYHAEMAEILDDVGARRFVPESDANTRRPARETRIARSEVGEDLRPTVTTESSVPAAF